MGTAEQCLQQQHGPVEQGPEGCRKPGPSWLPSCLSANAHLIKQQPGVAETRAAGELRFSSNRFPSPAQEPEEKPFSYCQINTQVVFSLPSPSPALLSPPGPGMLFKARAGLRSVPGRFCTSFPIPRLLCVPHMCSTAERRREQQSLRPSSQQVSERASLGFKLGRGPSFRESFQ